MLVEPPESNMKKSILYPLVTNNDKTFQIDQRTN